MRSAMAIGALFFMAGCAGADDGEATADSAEALVSSAPRAFALNGLTPTKTFAVPGGASEVCIVAKHWSEDGYSAHDAKKEAKLCSADFNAAPGANVLAAGLAPKANSTNPAIDVHEVTADVSRDVVESFAEANAPNRKAKKLGRIKSSLDDRFDATTTYAPSLMGYYATSRLLGDIAEVTPAVWRTVNVAHHEKVAANGKNLTVVGSQIVRKLWSTFGAVDASAQHSQLIYTADGGQLYGAFIPSVSGDEKDKSIDTFNGLTGSDRYRRLVDGRPIAQTIPIDFKSAVTTIVPMQGVVEMLVLDALLLQGDRLSGDNVSYIPYSYFAKSDGSVDRLSKDDFDDLAAADRPANAVVVNKLYLNDVDAGLIANNADGFQQGKEYGLLKQMKHVSPDLYSRLQKLAADVKDPAFTNYLTTELRFTDRDIYRYSAMVAAVSQLFHDRCTAGQLVLDLDLAKHLAKTNYGPGQGCN